MSLSTPSVRQVLHVLGLLVLLAIVVPFVVYAVPGAVGAEGGYVVLSGSMEPAISVGDVVIVDDADPATIEEGDVITYHRAGEETPTTHRVIDVLDEDGELAFQTMGDNNEDPDASPVPAPQVNGVVLFTIPYIGYVIEFANTPYGFVALVGVPFLLLVVSELYSFFRGAREKSSNPESGEPSDEIDLAVDEIEEPDPTDGAVTPELQGTEAEDDGTITITRTDLRLSLLLLVGMTIYAGWIVTLIQEPWSFSVAFASGIGVLLVGGMYYFAGAQEPSDEPAPGAATNGEQPTLDGRIVTGTLSMEDRGYPEVEVDSFQKLAKMSEAAGEWIVDDGETTGYYVLEDGVAYSWYPESASDATGSENAFEFSESNVESEESESADAELAGMPNPNPENQDNNAN